MNQKTDRNEEGNSWKLQYFNNGQKYTEDSQGNRRLEKNYRTGSNTSIQHSTQPEKNTHAHQVCMELSPGLNICQVIKQTSINVKD